MNLNGKWEGKLLDVTGPSALLEMNLKGSGEKVTGDFSVQFLSAEDGGCGGGTTRRLAQVGPIAGVVDTKKDRFRLDYQLTIGLEPIAVTFEGTITTADPHARRALVGSYSVGKGAEVLTLEGGTCLLWLFAK